jgi:hypothetical protein
VQNAEMDVPHPNSEFVRQYFATLIARPFSGQFSVLAAVFLEGWG